MTTNIQNTGTQICFRDSTDFNPYISWDLRVGTPTYVQIDTTSLSENNARQSDKVDLGSPRPIQYRVDMVSEHALVAPTALEVVELYWGASPSATAAVANPGVLIGEDNNYSALKENLAQLEFIGEHTLRATTMNTGLVGYLIPTHRYGSLVIVNRSATNFNTDAVETHVTFTPIAYGDT